MPIRLYQARVFCHLSNITRRSVPTFGRRGWTWSRAAGPSTRRTQRATYGLGLLSASIASPVRAPQMITSHSAARADVFPLWLSCFQAPANGLTCRGRDCRPTDDHCSEFGNPGADSVRRVSPLFLPTNYHLRFRALLRSAWPNDWPTLR